MRTPSIVALIGFTLLAVGGCAQHIAPPTNAVATTAPVASARPATLPSYEGDVEVPIFAVRPTGARGILVQGPAEISAGAPGKAFSYRLVNYLDEEVFVEMPVKASVGILLSKGADGEEIVASMGGVGSFATFPDNVHPLKRLHATVYSGGRDFTCGCATTRVAATLDADGLADFVGARGHVSVWVSGFLRSNGKRFWGSVDVPVVIVK